MKVCVSMNGSARKKVYHKQGCMYEKRIKHGNRKYLTQKAAAEKGYLMCRCCAGLKGELHIHRCEVGEWREKEKIMLKYDRMTNTVYAVTEIGAWKIFASRYGDYCLFHLNRFRKGLSFKEIRKGMYHCQSDVKPSASFTEIITYIIEHDKAKVIMMDDYHKLPRNTAQQKKYYKQAERRVRRRQRRRLDAIFASLERENPELRQYSMC